MECRLHKAGMANLIDQLGGIAAIADHLAVTRTSVSNWRLEGRGIPWKFRPALARLAADRAIALPDDYWQLRTPEAIRKTRAS